MSCTILALRKVYRASRSSIRRLIQSPRLCWIPRWPLSRVVGISHPGMRSRISHYICLCTLRWSITWAIVIPRTHTRRGQYVTFLLLASTRNLSFPEATKGLPVYNASRNQAVDIAEFRVPCGVKLNFLLTRQDADVKGNQRDYSSVCAAISLIQKLMLTNSVRSQCGSARDVSIGLTRKS